jgi:hypothetical protein
MLSSFTVSALSMKIAGAPAIAPFGTIAAIVDFM